MKFTQIPTTTFQEIQLNAGILAESFNPATGEVGRLLGATTGGVQFADAVEYTDFGEDIDNCPKNMMELKKLDNHEVTMSGTFITLSPSTAKMLVAVGDVDGADESHIVPRNDLLMTDFVEVWWIGDYSDINTGDNAGFIAIKLFNALNTGGFQIQSTDKAKGQFAFEFTGHYSMDAQDTVPYEIYIQQGVSYGVTLDKKTATVDEESTVTLTATTVPADAVVTWTSSDDTIATVASGVVTGVLAGTAVITASITVEGTEYTDTCTVTVEEV